MIPDYNSNNPFVANFGEVDAYLLGLVMADGCVVYQNGCYRMSIALNIKDRDILDKLHKHYKKGSLCEYTDNSGYREQTRLFWTIYDHNIVHGLMYFEIEPRKTCLEVLPSIPIDLMPHFLRGFFDGDGYVMAKYSEKYSRNIHRMGFALNRKIGEDINKLLERELDIKPKKIRPNGKSKESFLLEWSGVKDLKKLYEYMYNNSTIYLDRKKKIFDKLYSGLIEKGDKYHYRMFEED